MVTHTPVQNRKNRIYRILLMKTIKHPQAEYFQIYAFETVENGKTQWDTYISTNTIPIPNKPNLNAINKQQYQIDWKIFQQTIHLLSTTFIQYY